MKPKLESLDAVRAIACLFVVSFHAYLTLFGYSGLSMFFVLSGFLSAYNYADRDSVKRMGAKESAMFSIKKIAKLYPLHIAMLLIPLAGQIYGLVNGLVAPAQLLEKLAANALLVHAWIPLNDFYFSFNVPSWYLSVGLFLYFMLPVVLRAMDRYASPKAAYAAIGLIFLAQAVAADIASGLYARLYAPGMETAEAFDQWFTQVLPAYRLGDFAIGCNLAYIYMNRKPRKASAARATAFEAAAVLVWAAAEFAFERLNAARFVSTTELFILPSALIVYSFACGEGHISRALTNRAARLISDLSSDIYLIHFVAIMTGSIITTHLPLPEGAQKLAFVVYVCAFTLALALVCRRVRAARSARRRSMEARQG